MRWASTVAARPPDITTLAWRRRDKALPDLPAGRSQRSTLTGAGVGLVNRFVDDAAAVIMIAFFLRLTQSGGILFFARFL